MSPVSEPASRKPPPRHVGIIMDGNGRWAQARGLPRNAGHKAGVENVRKIVEAAKEVDLRYLTLYAFSVENWHRPKSEVEALMWLLRQFLETESQNLIDKQIRLRVLGSLDPLSKPLRKLLDRTIEATAGFDQWTLSLALNYGSRSEVVDAVREVARQAKAGQVDPETLDWDNFTRYLHTSELPDPDLIIRTSGEQRISNFLLLQSAYAEYYFAPEFWPDFGPKKFREAIETYQRRERRFGLTREQTASHTQ